MISNTLENVLECEKNLSIYFTIVLKQTFFVSERKGVLVIKTLATELGDKVSN